MTNVASNCLMHHLQFCTYIQTTNSALTDSSLWLRANNKPDASSRAGQLHCACFVNIFEGAQCCPRCNRAAANQQLAGSSTTDPTQQSCRCTEQQGCDIIRALKTISFWTFIMFSTSSRTCCVMIFITSPTCLMNERCLNGHALRMLHKRTQVNATLQYPLLLFHAFLLSCWW